MISYLQMFLYAAFGTFGILWGILIFVLVIGIIANFIGKRIKVIVNKENDHDE